MLLIEGLGAQQIGERLGIADSTVRGNIKGARNRLGVASSPEMIARIYAEGWGAPNPDRARAELAEERLAALVEEHAVEAKARLTPGQALYIRSFMRWLREPDSAPRAIERALCLRAMYYERRVIPPWEVLGHPHRTGPARAMLVSRRRPPKLFPISHKEN